MQDRRQRVLHARQAGTWGARRHPAAGTHARVFACMLTHYGHTAGHAISFLHTLNFKGSWSLGARVLAHKRSLAACSRSHAIHPLAA